jgi:hypothetical protein
MLRASTSRHVGLFRIVHRVRRRRRVGRLLGDFVGDAWVRASASVNRYQRAQRGATSGSDVLPVAFSSAGWTGILSFCVEIYILWTAEIVKCPSDHFFDTGLFLGDVEFSRFRFEARGGFRIWSSDEGGKVELDGGTFGHRHDRDVEGYMY